MERVKFLLYYSKLRLTALLGHRTADPLDMKWRWENWELIKSARQRRKQRPVKN